MPTIVDPEAVEFFLERTRGLYAVLERRLEGREYLAGEFAVPEGFEKYRRYIEIVKSMLDR